MTSIPNVNVTSPAFKANPYPFYAQLRAEAPVHPIMLPDKQTAWFITRYDDVTALLKDERFVKDKLNALTPEQRAKQPWVPGFLKAVDRNMLELDNPDHARLRGLVHKAFTPRLIETMNTRIQDITNELLDEAARNGRMDLMRDLALPLPMTVIAEMLGIPAADRYKFHRWSNAMIKSTASSWGKLLLIP